MKIYLIKHTGKIQWYKLEAWADIDKVGKNGLHIKSVKAFIKLKYAKEWIKEHKSEHLEILGVEL